MSLDEQALLHDIMTCASWAIALTRVLLFMDAVTITFWLLPLANWPTSSRRQMINPYSTGVLMPFAARWHSASSAACVSRSYHRVDVFLWLFIAIAAMHPSPLIREADLDARRALRIFLDVIMW